MKPDWLKQDGLDGTIITPPQVAKRKVKPMWTYYALVTYIHSLPPWLAWTLVCGAIWAIGSIVIGIWQVIYHAGLILMGKEP